MFTNETTEMAMNFDQMLYQNNIKQEQTNKVYYDGWPFHPNNFSSLISGHYL